MTLWLKEVFLQPRPFQISDEVLQLARGEGPGFPSGHTVTGTVVWLYLGSLSQRQGILIGSSFLALLVGLSRMYLGVHFPTDVVGGLLVGAGTLTALWELRRGRVRLWPWWIVGVGVALAGMLAVRRARLDPEFMRVVTGALWGLLGLYLEARMIRFSTAGPLVVRLLRLLPGSVGTAAMLLLGHHLTGRVGLSGPWAELILPSVRYGLAALWVTWGAPAVFLALKLAKREPHPDGKLID